MLPNHAPLVIAEQFGTLESLYPGRIDLGLGRAPGTDHSTARALRRQLVNSDDQFPQDVLELQTYFRTAAPGQVVRAVPGAGLDVPIWLLGSSLFSAKLAALLGLPYAFASHFAPDNLMAALALYRGEFRPSKVLQRPYAMAGIAVCAANTTQEAAHLFTSLQLQFINLRRGNPGPLNPPLETTEGLWTDQERLGIEHALREAIIGSPGKVQSGIFAFIKKTGVDELIVATQIFDHAARLRSFEIIAEVALGKSSQLHHEPFATAHES
jgi:luciferase family oxidoreductase group 1